MTRAFALPVPQVRTHGPGTAELAEYATGKVLSALRHCPAPVLFSRVTLDSAAPGHRVEVHVDVNGTGLHAHAIGATLAEAIDLMQQRLRSQLRHLRRRPAQGPARPAAAGRRR